MIIVAWIIAVAGLVASVRSTLIDTRQRLWIWAALDALAILAILLALWLLVSVYAFMPTGL